MNTCTSHQIFPICMQLKQDTPILRKEENISENVGPHEDKELILEEQDIEEDHRNLGDESLDTGSRIRDSLLGYTSQTGLLRSESLSFMRKIRFSDQEFAAGIPISNIKYNYPRFQNDILFYPFHD